MCKIKGTFSTKPLRPWPQWLQWVLRHCPMEPERTSKGSQALSLAQIQRQASGLKGKRLIARGMEGFSALGFWSEGNSSRSTISQELKDSYLCPTGFEGGRGSNQFNGFVLVEIHNSQLTGTHRQLVHLSVEVSGLRVHANQHQTHASHQRLTNRGKRFWDTHSYKAYQPIILCCYQSE